MEHDQSPGDYRVRCRLTDKVTDERVADFEHPLVVLSKEFGATRLRLTFDKEGKVPAGCHLTVGHQYFLQLLVANFEHKEGGIHASTRVSVRDRDGKDAARPGRARRHSPEGAGRLHLLRHPPKPLKAVKPGEATIVVEVEDLIGGKTVSYRLPAVIYPPRSLPSRHFTKGW